MYPVNCPICMGLGFVMIRKQNYEFKYRCNCPSGNNHRYDGRECKRKNNYYCPSINDLPSGTEEELVRANIKRHNLKKAGDRFLMDKDPPLTKEQIREMKELAWQMMKVKII